jgi:hypothetical protein
LGPPAGAKCGAEHTRENARAAFQTVRDNRLSLQGMYLKAVGQVPYWVSAVNAARWIRKR